MPRFFASLTTNSITRNSLGPHRRKVLTHPITYFVTALLMKFESWLVVKFMFGTSDTALPITEDGQVDPEALSKVLEGYVPTTAQTLGFVGLFMCWLANLVAFISDRVSAAETRDRIDRATRRVVHQANAGSITP